MNFFPLQRIEHGESTRPGLAAPGTFRLQGSLTLLTVFSSPSLPALFHAGDAHGVLPFRGFPSRGAAPPRRRRLTLLAFFPARCLLLQTEGGGRPLPRHLGFREGPLHRLQGFCLPKSPFASANSFRFCRWPIPSWAFSFLRSTPHAQMQRISPPLLSRAWLDIHPESKLPKRITGLHHRVSLCAAVTFPPKRAPDPYKVSCLRSSHLYRSIAVRDYRFSSNPG
jgi:hypothetical protein